MTSTGTTIPVLLPATATVVSNVALFGSVAVIRLVSWFSDRTQQLAAVIGRADRGRAAGTAPMVARGTGRSRHPRRYFPAAVWSARAGSSADGQTCPAQAVMSPRSHTLPTRSCAKAVDWFVDSTVVHRSSFRAFWTGNRPCCRR
jgi:hypothetical protein